MVMLRWPAGWRRDPEVVDERRQLKHWVQPFSRKKCDSSVPWSAYAFIAPCSLVLGAYAVESRGGKYIAHIQKNTSVLLLRFSWVRAPVTTADWRHDVGMNRCGCWLMTSFHFRTLLSMLRDSFPYFLKRLHRHRNRNYLTKVRHSLFHSWTVTTLDFICSDPSSNLGGMSPIYPLV